MKLTQKCMWMLSRWSDRDELWCNSMKQSSTHKSYQFKRKKNLVTKANGDRGQSADKNHNFKNK